MGSSGFPRRFCDLQRRRASVSGDVGCAMGEGWSGGTFSGLQSGCPQLQVCGGKALVLRRSEAAQASPQCSRPGAGSQ
jgi:hypothetical protein